MFSGHKEYRTSFPNIAIEQLCRKMEGDREPHGYASGNQDRPRTGRRLESSHRRGSTRRFRLFAARECEALHRALGALQGVDEREQSRRLLPGNAGKAWTHAEEQQVCDELRRGINFQEIAKAHNRTVVSIVARLMKLGKIAAQASTTKAA